jgi:4-amino-4-deoxy-L-arabinose transferase-like glycosyltransferase
VEYNKKREIITISIIFVIALIPRLLFTFLFDITPYVVLTDMDFNHYQAICMVKGGILKGGCYNPPLYAMFLALIYRIFSVNYLVVGIIQSIISSFSCILIYLITKMTLNRLSGIISAVICAIYFPFIFYTSTLFSENQYIFLVLLALYFLLLFHQRRKIGFLILSALCTGLAMATKTAVVAIMSGMLLWLAVSLRHNIRALIKYVVIFIVVFVVTISPVSLRNYLILNRFTLISAKSAAFLALRTHKIKRAEAYFNTKYKLNKPLNVRHWKWLYFDKGLTSLIDYYKKANREYLKKDPYVHLKLIPDNIWGYFFRNYYDVFHCDNPFMSYMFRIYQGIFSVILLPVFIVSFFVIPKEKLRAMSLFYFVTFSNMAFFLILWGHPRFRMPTDIFFIIIFVVTVSELLAYYKQRANPNNSGFISQ